MSLLAQQDRDYILEQLKLAPDHILAEAMLQFNKIRDMVVAARKIANGNVPGSAPVVQAAIENAAEPAREVVRKNVSPGPSAIGKIGANTKHELLKQLRQGYQPDAKFSDHLKLLWARGEVKYDGSLYYL